MARLLNSMELEVFPLDDPTARAVGVLCGLSGHADVADVHVMLHARAHDHHVVMSDPGDLARVDPSVRLIVV